jgi:hypothetical protein
MKGGKAERNSVPARFLQNGIVAYRGARRIL